MINISQSSFTMLINVQLLFSKVSTLVIYRSYFTNRLFARILSGLSKLSYFSRLKIQGLETLERRRLINDLVLYYKILTSHYDLVLNVAPRSSITRGNNFKLSKQTCSIDVRKFFILIELSSHGTVYL